ncbi:MAG: hypothetical protein HKM95_17480 [Inquilinus sp.]|nr:hypothetical protein [Inquilinus sp.]
MITANRIAAALYACYRLARRDSGGMAYFDRTAQGARESFFAAVLLAPIVFALSAAEKWEELQTLFIPQVVVLKLLFYVIGWTLVPVLAIWLVEWLDRKPRYFDLVIAYNWISVPAVLCLLPLQILYFSGTIGREVFATIGLAVMLVVMVYEWFIVKTALDINGGLAAGLVAMDFVLSQLLFAMSDYVVYGG